MQSDNRLFDDLAKMAGGAAGLMLDLRKEIEATVRQNMERLMRSMDMVSRDEFDAMKDVALKAREGEKALEKRVAALEKKLQAKGDAKKKKTAKGA